ncbi:hypothetical protein CHS0354_020775 [Potamilus streckersoni]|uniref:Secreted protein n=1 Tax=Potamilus streckersoni TaxID=2493646 RepID=A0AAE0VUH4_9BIVA|nr:hypothetical protein CHS0354_020775 [Potamilus streckersoni]
MYFLGSACLCSMVFSLVYGCDISECLRKRFTSVFSCAAYRDYISCMRNALDSDSCRSDGRAMLMLRMSSREIAAPNCGFLGNDLTSTFLQNVSGLWSRFPRAFGDDSDEMFDDDFDDLDDIFDDFDENGLWFLGSLVDRSLANTNNAGSMTTRAQTGGNPSGNTGKASAQNVHAGFIHSGSNRCRSSLALLFVLFLLCCYMCG